MSDILPLFLHETRTTRQKRQTSGKRKRDGTLFKENLTYPAVPRVPKLGHADIEADTEGEGSSKYGCHIDTCGTREE
jgi:hypothetical protein